MGAKRRQEDEVLTMLFELSETTAPSSAIKRLTITKRPNEPGMNATVEWADGEITEDSYAAQTTLIPNAQPGLRLLVARVKDNSDTTMREYPIVAWRHHRIFGIREEFEPLTVEDTSECRAVRGILDKATGKVTALADAVAGYDGGEFCDVDTFLQHAKGEIGKRGAELDRIMQQFEQEP